MSVARTVSGSRPKQKAGFREKNYLTELVLHVMGGHKSVKPASHNSMFPTCRGHLAEFSRDQLISVAVTGYVKELIGCDERCGTHGFISLFCMCHVIIHTSAIKYKAVYLPKAASGGRINTVPGR